MTSATDPLTCTLFELFRLSRWPREAVVDDDEFVCVFCGAPDMAYHGEDCDISPIYADLCEELDFDFFDTSDWYFTMWQDIGYNGHPYRYPVRCDSTWTGFVPDWAKPMIRRTDRWLDEDVRGVT